MIRHALLGALALVCAGAAASPFARADDACVAPYDLAVSTGTLVTKIEHGATFLDYAGEDAAKLIKVINEDPPATDYPADRVLVLERPAVGTARIALVVGQCVTRATTVSEDKWLSLKAAAFGEPL